MKERISELLRVIREEINLCRELAEHARRKTPLLVQGCIEDILESNKVEEMHTSRLLSLKQEMHRLCADFGQSFGIPREEITLMKLADLFEQSTSREIKAQADLFRGFVQQLRSASRQNLKLSHKSIDYSRGLLAIVANASGSYRQNGLFEQIPSIPPTYSRQA